MKKSVNNSAADLLNLARPDLQGALFSNEKLDQLETLSRSFPPAAILGLECRLSENSDRVDLAFCIYGRSGFEVLSDFIQHRIASNQIVGAGWVNILSFAQHWLKKRDFLNQMVSALWLNVDIDSELPLTDPWIYIVYQNTILEHDITASGLEQSLRILDQHYPPRTIECLRKNVNSLPPRAHILGLGVQTTRNTDALRLVIYNLNVKDILAFLSSAEKNYDINTLAPLMEPFEKFSTSLGFIFDIGEEGIRPVIGIEYYLNKQTTKRDIQGFIELLKNQHHCIPQKLEALKKVSGNEANGNVAISLNHIKMVYSYTQIKSVKAYVGCAYPENKTS